MRIAALLFAGLVVCVALPSPAAAQGAAQLTLAPSATELQAAARLQPSSATGARESQPALGATLMAQGSHKRTQGEVLMIVGAAGIITGLLVDEDIVTIAGAGVGGFGLYLFLSGR